MFFTLKKKIHGLVEESILVYFWKGLDKVQSGNQDWK